MDDCFEGEEVKYGFRSTVTLLENSPCILGSTCKGVPVNVTNPENQDNQMNLENQALNSKLFLRQNFKISVTFKVNIHETSQAKFVKFS